jgi:DNA-binding response OmpR family regulator
MAIEIPDLLLTDLAMPTVTGWELLSRVGRDRELSQIPVVVFSAERPGTLRGLPLMAVFVPKPAEPEVLLAVVREAIDQRWLDDRGERIDGRPVIEDLALWLGEPPALLPGASPVPPPRSSRRPGADADRATPGPEIEPVITAPVR